MALFYNRVDGRRPLVGTLSGDQSIQSCRSCFGLFGNRFKWETKEADMIQLEDQGLPDNLADVTSPTDLNRETGTR